jgi:hypothetical protein
MLVRTNILFLEATRRANAGVLHSVFQHHRTSFLSLDPLRTRPKCTDSKVQNDDFLRKMRDAPSGGGDGDSRGNDGKE